MALCSSCGSQNPADKRFCADCGSPLTASCPSCGASVEPGKRFCGECGTSLASSVAPVATVADKGANPVAERRVCSVLFADLVGFTPLSEARDAEEVRELLSRYFEVARTVIARYGGVVEKFIGDAVMAVWGTPVAEEGDAERAVRAAMDLLDAVAALGVEVSAPDLAARAGVVTGEVAVTIGAVGEGMVAGDTVNTAARVQTAAQPGTVLVDDHTRRLAVDGIGFTDAGEHTLKGKAEPQRLWRATRVLAGVGGAQRVDGLEARLVGRDAEMRMVRELFHASADRRTPRMVVLSGAAGVGKSRLGWEFEKHVDGLADLVNWHRGRCLSYGEGVAFWALTEAVRQRLKIAEEDPTDVAAAKLLAGVAAIISDPEERTYVAVRVARLLGVALAEDSGALFGREELFAGWRTLFERLAAAEPVIWLVEDAQYADAGLLDFLDHLIDWTRDLPIFVLVLTRPELEERRPGFGVGRNRTLLALDPLDPASMDVLVEELVPGMPVEARNAITTHAQGIPLFAVETIRTLVDRDVVVPIEGSYRLVGEVGELAVPTSLQALLAARLDALGPALRSLVSDASVLGTSFPEAAVAALAGRTDEEVRGGLAELVRREVFEVSADRLSPQHGSYRFTQNLLRQVAYERLSRHDRKARHLSVAAHLRATFADDGEEVSDALARHYGDALEAVPDADDADELRSQAIEMNGRAAERSLRAGAPEAAAASFSVAARLGEATAPDDAARWWGRAAEAATMAGKWDVAIDAAEQARIRLEVGGDPRAVARGQSRQAGALRLAGRYTEARPLFVAALDVLHDEPDEDTFYALVQFATLEMFSGNHVAGETLVHEALLLGQRIGVSAEALAECFIRSGISAIFGNRIEQGEAYLRQAARLAERADSAVMRLRALINLSDSIISVDPEDALAASHEAIVEGRRMGYYDGVRFGVTNAVDALLYLGRWDEARALLAHAVTADGLGEEAYTQSYRATVAALSGDAQTAEAAAAAVVGMTRSEDAQDQAMIDMAGAFVAYARRDVEAVHDAVSALLPNALAALGLDSSIVRLCWPLAARAARTLRDDAAVRLHMDQLEQASGRLPTHLRALFDLARAWLASDAGDDSGARALYESVIVTLRRIPTPYYLAHALLDQAEHHAAHGEGEAATDGVQEAITIAERLGAVPLLERARTVASAVLVG